MNLTNFEAPCYGFDLFFTKQPTKNIKKLVEHAKRVGGILCGDITTDGEYTRIPKKVLTEYKVTHGPLDNGGHIVTCMWPKETTVNVLPTLSFLRSMFQLGCNGTYAGAELYLNITAESLKEAA